MGGVSLTLVNVEQRVHPDLKTTLMSTNTPDVIAHPCNIGDHRHEWSALLLVSLGAILGSNTCMGVGWGRGAVDQVGRITILPDDSP